MTALLRKCFLNLLTKQKNDEICKKYLRLENVIEKPSNELFRDFSVARGSDDTHIKTHTH